jgi:hypothetical protein
MLRIFRGRHWMDWPDGHKALIQQKNVSGQNPRFQSWRKVVILLR